MSWDLDDLRVFVAVAEELHFGRAAERLSVGQPAISRQVRLLERKLGADLFERTTRAVRLTAAGAALLEESRPLLKSADRVTVRVREVAEGIGRPYEIGFVSSAAVEAVPALVATMQARDPGSRLVMTELFEEEMIARLKRGELDLGMVRVPLRDRAVTFSEVRSEPLMAAVPALHPLASASNLPLSALRTETWVFWGEEMAPAQHRALWASCRRAGFTPDVGQETSSVATTLALVGIGLGVAVVAGCYASQATRGVALVPLEDLYSSLYLAWRQDRSRELAPLLDSARSAFDALEAIDRNV